MANLAPRLEKRRARLEIIPFIDIMFFLLATFMMASVAMVQNYGIDLKLPAATTGQLQDDQAEPLTVSVTRDGRLFLNQEQINPDELINAFRSLQQQDAGQPIILQGDYGSEFGKVVEVFDQARAAGLERLTIRTRPAEE